MQFMLILGSQRGAKFDESVFPKMGGFAGGLAAQGKMRGGSPLRGEQDGVRVRLSRGKIIAKGGPFSETKEVIDGFFLIECKSKREAVAIAKRCPHIANGFVEVRRVIPMGGDA